jgi:hypothetical protein
MLGKEHLSTFRCLISFECSGSFGCFGLIRVQCGLVAYKVLMLPPEEVNVCNCSICTRNGYARVYVPRTDVRWISGYDQLNEFRFATERLTHKFYPECGSSMLRDPNFGYKNFSAFKGAPDILCLNVHSLARQSDVKIS